MPSCWARASFEPGASPTTTWVVFFVTESAMRPPRDLIRVSAAAFLVAMLEACGPTVDARAALQIESVSSGWVDAGSAGGSHKIVPSVSFRVKNASASTLAPVQVNAIFRRARSFNGAQNPVGQTRGKVVAPDHASRLARVHFVIYGKRWA